MSSLDKRDCLVDKKWNIMYMFMRRFEHRESKFMSRMGQKYLVREAEVILPTFSRDKFILLLNCQLDA